MASNESMLSACPRYQAVSTLDRQKVEWWLPVLGGGGAKLVFSPQGLFESSQGGYAQIPSLLNEASRGSCHME